MAPIPILIVSHGSFAGALLATAEMIVGQQEMVGTLGLEETDGLTNFAAKVQLAANHLASKDGLLVLMDLLGGTPSNAVLALDLPGVHAVAGVNLPMLLEVLMSRESGSAAELAERALEAGRQGVCSVGYARAMQSDGEGR